MLHQRRVTPLHTPLYRKHLKSRDCLRILSWLPAILSHCLLTQALPLGLSMTVQMKFCRIFHLFAYATAPLTPFLPPSFLVVRSKSIRNHLLDALHCQSLTVLMILKYYRIFHLFAYATALLSPNPSTPPTNLHRGKLSHRQVVQKNTKRNPLPGSSAQHRQGLGDKDILNTIKVTVQQAKVRSSKLSFKYKYSD